VAEVKKKPAPKKPPAKRSGSAGSGGWTAEERAAMRETARERAAEARRGNDRAAGEKDLLAKIGEMRGSDRTLATKLHALVSSVAPGLDPKTWYGMPAYAKEGKVVVFFKPAEKFKSRYATVGFEEAANLDSGEMWVTSYALLEWTPAVEKKLGALVKKAVR
jgi:uncharacterized protein YdhG (YjbR/CyaY superfamily)